MKNNLQFYALAGLAAALLVWYVSANAQEIGAAVPGIVADAGAGVALGIGDVLGVPRTDMSECEKAIADGRTWDASFACPIGTFAKYVTN